MYIHIYFIQVAVRRQPPAPERLLRNSSKTIYVLWGYVGYGPCWLYVGPCFFQVGPCLANKLRLGPMMNRAKT